MESTSTLPTPTTSGTKQDVPPLGGGPPLIGTNSGGGASCHQVSVGCAQSVTDATTSGHSRRENELALLTRHVAGALKESIAELRKDDDTRMSQLTTTLQGQLSTFREGEEIRIARLEKAITDLRPPPNNVDPTTNFWTIYKKVADEHDNDLVLRYTGDLDTSLLFAGLFSAVTTAFIVQLVHQLRPDPGDLTNALLLRILEQNTSFTGDPLAPISNIPTSVVRAQAILFASLAVTLFVAFIAVLGKQWILYYTRVTTWGNIVDRGKERQAKLVGLQKWGLNLIMELLPAMLQFALLLFGVALTVYLWDLDVSSAEVVLVVTSVGLAFYACTVVVATIRGHFPFHAFLSVLIPMILRRAKEIAVLARVRFRRWSRRRAVSFLMWVERVTDHGRLASSLGRLSGIFATGTTIPNRPDEDTFTKHYSMKFSNPAFWRKDPLFTSSVPKDISASAGFWLLENSTNPSTASAVAAVFSEIQWPSHYRSTATLNRLRDAYTESLRAPEPNNSTRLKALQSAAAYYILYHTQLIWSTSNNLEVEVGKLPSDLFVHLPSEEWGGDDVFEYLLHAKDRSEPVTSARFLSYVAPYWFCGDSDATIRFRPSRLQTLNDLIEVLEESRALNPTTVTDCILCAGAAMDFPLHPEDLIRVDKSRYFALTFKTVVEHIHGIVLARGRRRRHTKTALEVLLTLVKKTTLALIEATWINGLLKRAVGGNMDDDTLTLFLRLSARREEEDTTADAEISSPQDYAHVRRFDTDPRPFGRATSSEISTPDDALFNRLLQNVKICSEREDGWQDEAVYGGLIAIRDIPRLGSCFPNDDLIRTLSNAMEKENKPFRVRKAAYDVIVAAQDGWLKSANLRQTLEDLDIPRQLHSVVIETARSDHQVSFLKMMETLSEDRFWHSYLRGAMEIWLPFRHEGPDRVLRILSNVGQLPLPEYDGSNPPLDKFLEKLVEDQWAGVPGRLLMDLTADRLEPLAEVTKRLKELSFTENDRRAVLAVVELVIPSLERRRDGGYEGPGDDIRGIVNRLLKALRAQSINRRPSYW